MTIPREMIEAMSDEELPLEEEAVEEEQPKRGPLLDEEDEKRVAKDVDDLVDAQASWHSYHCAIWSRNRAWRKGRRGVRIVEDTDRATFEAKLPAGSSQQSPSPNNLNKLIKRVAATLTVDAPMAEVAPVTGDQDDTDKAELSEKLLAADAGPGGSNDVRLGRQVVDLAGTYGSAFVHLYVHPTAGGRYPVELECHPLATSIAGPDGQPDVNLALLDPNTGMADPAGVLVRKYVNADGVTLQETPAGAQMQWQPKVCTEILTGKTLWFLPVNARDISDAKGVVIGYVTTLGELESQYPEIASWEDKRREALASWRPDNVKHWLHPMMDAAMKEAVSERVPMKDKKGRIDPQTPVFCYRLYYAQSSVYPEGAVVLTSGEEVLYRDVWSATVGEGDDAREEALLVPVAQFRWADDAVDQSPYGIAGAEDLGPSEEIRAQQMAALVEYLHRFNHPNVYLPVGSPVTPEAMSRRDGTPIRVNMDGGGKPIYETIPPFPAESMAMYDRLGAEQNSGIGLEQAAQGVASASVKSGKHAETIVEQALVALANQAQNLGDFYSRLWTIKLQLWRAFYDTPRVANITGEGGQYKEKRWRGVDLTRSTDVRISKSSLTLLSPSAKQQLAMQELEIARASGDPMAYEMYRKVSARGMHPAIGVTDDPQANRMGRQMAAWWDGPDEELIAADAEFQQMQAMQPPPQPMIGPDGQPQPPQQQPSPLQQAAQRVFQPLPSDEEPTVARARWLVLRDEIAKARVATKPPVWQTALFAEYDRMRKAAGVMTIAEQQQAAQAAQQAQAQGEAAKVQAETQAKTQQQIAVKQAGAAVDAELDAAKDARAMEREMMGQAAKAAQSPSEPFPSDAP